MIPIVRVTMWPVNGKLNKESKDVNLITMASKAAPRKEDLEEFVKCGVVDEYYHVEEEIGRGTYGTVKKCHHKENGNTFAAKIIKTSNNNIRKDVLREIAMMRKLAHHNRIVALYDAFQTPMVITMVMEYVPGGELFELIVKEEFLMEDEAIDYVKQILEALQFMHRKNIVHLDLKPENILCVNQDESRDIKLVDFGLARQLQEGCEVKSSFGTPDFVAPEVIRMRPISKACDMWSLGVLTYVLLSGLMPFSGDDDNHTLVKVAKVDWDFDDECFDDLSDNAKDFIEGLLEKEPRDRYTVDECLLHPWITSKIVVPLKIATKKHKTWMAKRMWKKSINALVAVRRMSLSPIAAKARRRSMDSLKTKESEEKPDTKESTENNQGKKELTTSPPMTRPYRSYTDSEGHANPADRKGGVHNMHDVAKEALKLARNFQQASPSDECNNRLPNGSLNGLKPPVLKVEDETLVNCVNTLEKGFPHCKETNLASSRVHKNGHDNSFSPISLNSSKLTCTASSVFIKECSTSREFDPVVMKINKDNVSKVEVINKLADTTLHSLEGKNVGKKFENSQTAKTNGQEKLRVKNEPLCIHSTRTKISQNCFFIPQKITVQLDRCSVNEGNSTDNRDRKESIRTTNKEGAVLPPITVSVSYNKEETIVNGNKESSNGNMNIVKDQDTVMASDQFHVRCKINSKGNCEENNGIKSGEMVTIKLDSYSDLEIPAQQASTAHLRRASTGSPALAIRRSLLQ